MALRFRTRQIPMQTLAEAMDGATAVYRGEETIVHQGASCVVTATGQDRAQAIRDALPDIECEGDVGPVWLGGFAFDSEHAPDGPWAGYPSARFQLPARQLRWVDGRLFETICESSLDETREVGGALAISRESDWNTSVAAVCAAIHAGSVTKVVLTRTAPAPVVDVVASFMRLLELEQGIGFWFQLGGTFYGCTPERLVRLEDGKVTTHALAGSARTGDANLSTSGKDVLEHELVVAFVRERLVEAGVQGVYQDPRGLRELRHIQHLETPIHGRAEGHILNLVAHLHPTPAVCGTPRTRALAMIREMERHQRGWYTGTIGWFDPEGDGEFAVALRCALQTDTRTLFAGAGIVAGSEPATEWLETETKLAALREAG